MNGFTEEQIKEFKECFDINDFDKDGKLSSKELINILRTFGQEPELEDIKDLIEELGVEDKQSINFQDFLQIMNRIAKDADIELELIEAFKIFDKENKGVISASEFKHLLLTIGDRLGDDKIEEMLIEGDKNGNGTIKYAEFAKNILSKY